MRLRRARERIKELEARVENLEAELARVKWNYQPSVFPDNVTYYGEGCGCPCCSKPRYFGA